MSVQMHHVSVIKKRHMIINTANSRRDVDRGLVFLLHDVVLIDQLFVLPCFFEIGFLVHVGVAACCLFQSGDNHRR